MRKRAPLRLSAEIFLRDAAKARSFPPENPPQDPLAPQGEGELQLWHQRTLLFDDGAPVGCFSAEGEFVEGQFGLTDYSSQPAQGDELYFGKHDETRGERHGHGHSQAQGLVMSATATGTRRPD